MVIGQPIVVVNSAIDQWSKRLLLFVRLQGVYTLNIVSVILLQTTYKLR